MILKCQGAEKIKGTSNKNNLADVKEQGILEIEFISKEDFEIENIRILFSRSLPELKIKKVVKVNDLLPFPETVEINKKPILYDNIEYSFQQNIRTNKKYKFIVEPGEYFVSMDSLANSDFQFNVYENKVLLFQFGYDIERESDDKKKWKLVEYNQNCKYGLALPYYEYSSVCPKIMINQNKTTRIQVNASDAKAYNLMQYGFKFLGIIILSPFHNLNGYLYYRDYVSEIKNLE